MRQILEGDTRAGERFVREHYPRVFRVLRSLTGNPDLAEDLTQQTFVQAWEHLPQYRGEARLSTWLHRIAYRVYTHWLRDQKETLPFEAQEQRPCTGALHGLVGLQVERAIGQLSPPLREVFVLCGLWEYSLHEAAAILEVPVGTVKWRMHEARRNLRAILSDTAEEPSSAAISPGTEVRKVRHHENPSGH